MRKWFFILILVFLIASPLSAAGQTAVTINSIQVDIRPEYDRDSLLVMYDIELPQSALNTPIGLRIPASAGSPFALAYGSGDGNLYDLAYERQVSGQWAYIKFTTPMTYVRLEYYDSVIKNDNGNRSFSYVWPGDYAVGAMTLLLMQPWGATQMQISPGQWTSQVDSNGLTLFGSEIGSVPLAEEIEINVSYVKTSDDLVAEHLVPQASGTIPESADASVQWQQFIPWLLGVVGALMLGGGLYWYWKTGRQESGSPRRRKVTRPAQQAPTEIPAPGSGGQGGYCHQCGNRTAASDRFCRVCGTRLGND